jgi:hypothetical protein
MSSVRKHFLCCDGDRFVILLLRRWCRGTFFRDGFVHLVLLGFQFLQPLFELLPRSGVVELDATIMTRSIRACSLAHGPCLRGGNSN